MSGTVAVRYREGVVSQSRREAHLASVTDAQEPPDPWTTFCGLHIPAELAEVAPGPAGMPCMGCLMRSAALADSTEAIAAAISRNQAIEDDPESNGHAPSASSRAIR